MPTYMPDTIQKALGEAATRDFTPWLETFMTERTVGQDTWKLAQDRFDGLEQRQTAVETRQTAVETRLTAVETRLTIVEHDLSEIKVELREFKREVNERFDRLTAMFNERFDRQSAEMNTRLAEINSRFDVLQQQMLSQTRWTVGTLALFGTLIAILVGIGQLRP